jgi:hypothetical protein
MLRAKLPRNETANAEKRKKMDHRRDTLRTYQVFILARVNGGIIQTVPRGVVISSLPRGCECAMPVSGRYSRKLYEYGDKRPEAFTRIYIG